MTEALNRALEGAQRLPEAEQDVVAQLLLEKIHAFEVLATYSHDLTALARAGRFAPLQQREMEIERIFQIVARRLKNNPVLFGEPASERINIVTEIARRVSSGDVPEGVKIRSVVALDMEALCAGAPYQSEIEERLTALFQAIRQLEGLVLLFVDNIHRLAEIAAHLLVPPLSRGELQILGTCTLEEYRRSIERNQALQRRFQEVIIRDEAALTPSPESPQ